MQRFRNWLNSPMKIPHFLLIGLLLTIIAGAPYYITQTIKSTIFVTRVANQAVQPQIASAASTSSSRYGLSQPTSSELAALQLPDPPLFSYGITGMGKIHTFVPCGMSLSNGCVNKSQVIPGDSVTTVINSRINNVSSLKTYILQHPNEYWTVFNEPELGGDTSVYNTNNSSWTANPEQYAKIWLAYYKIFYDTFGGDTSKFTMFFAGMGTNASHWSSFINNVITAYHTLYSSLPHDAFPQNIMPVGAWTFHAYPGGQSCEIASDYNNGVNTTKSLANGFINFINSLDGGKYSSTPIWLTEWGWIRNHQIPNDTNTIVANTPCVSRYIYDTVKFLETDPAASTRITKVFYFPIYLKAAAPGGWPDADYPTAHTDWPAWSGWLSQNGQLTDPGKQYACMAKGGDLSYCPWGPNGANLTSLTWTQLPGLGNDISIGANGSVWIVGTQQGTSGYPIYYWNGNTWISISGLATRIAVAPDGTPWVINSAKQMYHYVNNTWISIPGLGNDIGVGANGSVWVIGTGAVTGGYEIWYWNGSTWVKTDGGAVRVAVAPDGSPWVINSDGRVFHRVNNSWTKVLSPAALDIGVGANGAVWITGTDSSIYMYNGNGWSKTTSGLALTISVDKNGKPWVINSSKQIFRGN